jgi:hypothetical protein
VAVKKGIKCLEVRGSVVAPTVSYPGYYLIFGKRRDLDEREKSLIFLCEGKEKLQGRLFERLKIKAGNLYCHAIYTHYSIKRLSEFALDLGEALRDLGVNVYGVILLSQD